MIVLQGIGIGEDICIGKLSFWQKKNVMHKRACADKEKELARFHQACGEASKKLQILAKEAEQAVGIQNAAIFQMQELLLSDIQFVEEVKQTINTQSVSAEYAVKLIGEQLAEKMELLEDAYMQARAADFLDVTQQLIEILEKEQLTGELPRGTEVQENLEAQACTEVQDMPCIIVADDLLPSETIGFNKKQIAGIILRKGNRLSHAAILAKAMEIPALLQVGQELLADYEGKVAVLEGETGTLYIDPDSELLQAMSKKQEEREGKKQKLKERLGKHTYTGDGRKIKLYANAGNIEQVESAIENAAEGIGLFRSEQLFLGQETAPDEEEQFEVYRQVLERLEGKEAIIRTVDIGADKQVGYLNLPEEENPALGFRGIRLCLKQPELLRTQLRALFRASVYGRLSIMYPMITSLEEVVSLRKLEVQVKEELLAQEIAFDKLVPVGIMVETPAAALISDELAGMVDFFSVGTNDLTQYTLALDRQNGALTEFYNPHHKAVLRLLEMTVTNAKKAGIPVGICGELATELSLLETFIRMGIDELSVPVGNILAVRQHIASLSLTEE